MGKGGWPFFFKIYLFGLLLAMWGLCGACGLSTIVASRGYTLAGVCGLLTATASLVMEHGL